MDKNLLAVAVACAVASERIADEGHLYEMKKITLPGGVESFRFVMVLDVHGQKLEVQVRPKPDKEAELD